MEVLLAEASEEGEDQNPTGIIHRWDRTKSFSHQRTPRKNSYSFMKNAVNAMAMRAMMRIAMRRTPVSTATADRHKSPVLPLPGVRGGIHSRTFRISRFSSLPYGIGLDSCAGAVFRKDALSHWRDLSIPSMQDLRAEAPI
jgi:hypothetical protein